MEMIREYRGWTLFTLATQDGVIAEKNGHSLVVRCTGAMVHSNAPYISMNERRNYFEAKCSARAVDFIGNELMDLIFDCPLEEVGSLMVEWIDCMEVAWEIAKGLTD
jgi:hypothetical protein